MGCSLFILAQNEFDYFLPPMGAKIPVLYLELLQVAHILPFFIIIPLFSLLSIYLSYLNWIRGRILLANKKKRHNSDREIANNSSLLLCNIQVGISGRSGKKQIVTYS